MITEEKKIKTIKIFLLMFMLLSIILCCVFVLNIKLTRKVDVSNYKKVSIDDNYMYDLKINKENNKHIIEGYICDINTSIKTSSIHIVLEDENGCFYQIPTYVIYREDLNGVVHNNNELGWSGFKSEVKNFNNCKIYLLLNINEDTKLINMNKEIKD